MLMRHTSAPQQRSPNSAESMQDIRGALANAQKDVTGAGGPADPPGRAVVIMTGVTTVIVEALTCVAR